MEKFENEFQRADMLFIAGSYSENNPEDVEQLFAYLTGASSAVSSYNGELNVVNGQAQNSTAFTLINSRSFAENIVYSRDGVALTESIGVTAGQLADLDINVTGDSLLHSVPLTTRAFTRGLFGDYGQYIVAIGLMLFAFSTAIAWSYYGDRAMIYLFGPRSILPYRIAYVLGFFYAALADTTIVWNISLITIVLMTVPNLIGISFMHKEVKQTINQYWEKTEHGRHRT